MSVKGPYTQMAANACLIISQFFVCFFKRKEKTSVKIITPIFFVQLFSHLAYYWSKASVSTDNFLYNHFFLCFPLTTVSILL